MTATQEGPILPTLFGAQGRMYEMRPANFVFSFAIQAAAICVLVALAMYAPPVSKPGLKQMFNEISPLRMPFIAEKPGGSGGGGSHEKLMASHGALPEMNLEEQFTPPQVVLKNPNPQLPMPPSILAITTVKLPQLGVLGDPRSSAAAPSNGVGGPSGTGSHCCNGVGDNNGPGFGDDKGLIYQPGRNGVTQPKVLYDPDPEYSEEAREAKFQGSVILQLIVGADGKPHHVLVQRSAGMGLDEKAMAAVNQWRFQPASLDGHPVAVRMNVEVSFRLFLK